MDAHSRAPTARARRPSGRDAKIAARTARSARLRPLHHPQHSLLRGAGRGGTGAARAQRRHHPGGDRHRLPRRPGVARSCGRRPAPTCRASGCASRAACAARLVQRSAPREFTQYARNPARNVVIGGKPHRVRPGLRLPVRAQPRRGAPLRADRGLPQLREARLRVDLAAPLRRHHLRAGRPAGQQAALRHGLQPHEVQRQAVHGLGDRIRSAPRTPSR